MNKKRDKEELDRIIATYNALFNDIEDTPIEEIRRALADAGVDRSALRERLHSRAKEIARAARAQGRAALPALVNLIDQTGDAKTLSGDPKRAFDKAKRYMSNLFMTGTPGTATQIVGAFRGEGDLNEHDKQTIEEIDTELRKRAESEGVDEPSKE